MDTYTKEIESLAESIDTDNDNDYTEKLIEAVAHFKHLDKVIDDFISKYIDIYNDIPHRNIVIHKTG